MENMQLSWDNFMILGALLCLAVAIGIFIYYEAKVLGVKDLKEKYDFVNTHEVRFFWYSVLTVILGAAMYTNSVVTKVFAVKGSLANYVRIFYTAGFLVIAYFIFSGLVRVLYPKIVERRLQKIRNKPRVSPQGNRMRKLSEEEEDAHLDASQISEEASDVHSVDYDVWIDDKTGFKKVEKYMNYQHTEQCSECGFWTMKIYHEDVESQPTQEMPGLLLRHYRCSYCHHREVREATIAKLSSNVS